MIAAHAQTEDGLVIFLGLSRENINRLVAGQPILVHAENVGLGGKGVKNIAIAFGETEAEIEGEMIDAGVIDPQHTTILRGKRP